MDREAFFDVMRSEFGALSQSQVEGTEKLLDEGEKRQTALRQLAYILSTSWHETAATMQPIAEYGKGEGHDYGEPCEDYGGQVAYGRGYVQLTWQENYERADKECVLNGALLDNFDLALDAAVAAQIIFEGMSAGWFTGKKLDDYINPSVTDYYNARRIVNGTDRADMLKGYAETYQSALEAGRYGEAEPIDPDEITTPPDEAEHPPAPIGELYEYVCESFDPKSMDFELAEQGWRLIQIAPGNKLLWERRIR